MKKLILFISLMIFLTSCIAYVKIEKAKEKETKCPVVVEEAS